VHNQIQTKLAFRAITNYSTDVQQDCSLADHIMLVAWCNGNAFCLINEVTLWRAWLLLWWVTVNKQVNQPA